MKSTKEQVLTNTIAVCGLAFICCALWGSAFPCLKIGYSLFHIPARDTAAQILFAGLRFTIAGILTVAGTSLAAGRPLYPKSKGETAAVVKLCMFQTVIQYALYYMGLARADGVKCSIIEGANVFVAILIAALIFKIERLTLPKLAGCVIGFAGVALISLGGGRPDLSVSLAGEGCVLLSTVAYGFSSVTMKRYSKIYNPIMMSGWQFLIGGLILTALGFCFGGRITVCSGAGAAMLFYLAFVSAAAYSLWAVLLKYNPVSKVCVYGFINPLCGVLFSALLLDEGSSAFGPRGLVSLALVCCGIYIANRNNG